jgi:hypothetical protein
LNILLLLAVVVVALEQFTTQVVVVLVVIAPTKLDKLRVLVHQQKHRSTLQQVLSQSPWVEVERKVQTVLILSCQQLLLLAAALAQQETM